ncbi:Uncharacterised protein [Mycobacteroides abscessus subsp. abscessus]|nr:Uncharacterised protein [Mycobacteroides abscessus subsp. abscessus]
MSGSRCESGVVAQRQRPQRRQSPQAAVAAQPQCHRRIDEAGNDQRCPRGCGCALDSPGAGERLELAAGREGAIETRVHPGDRVGHAAARQQTHAPTRRRAVGAPKPQPRTMHQHRHDVAGSDQCGRHLITRNRHTAAHIHVRAQASRCTHTQHQHHHKHDGRDGDQDADPSMKPTSGDIAAGADHKYL